MSDSTQEFVLKRLLEIGFDLHGVTTIASYNQSVKQCYTITPSPKNLNSLLVLGNTTPLWELFIKHIESDKTWLEKQNPFDDFVELQITWFENELIKNNIEFQTFFSHQLKPQVVAIQKAAMLAGIAAIAPSHLSIHPLHGPWISLRALVAFDNDQLRLSTDTPSEQLCLDCRNKCSIAFEKTLKLRPPSWESWLHVRDSCPLGQDHRFSDSQIKYHYTKDKTILKEVLQLQSSL